MASSDEEADAPVNLTFGRGPIGSRMIQTAPQPRGNDGAMVHGSRTATGSSSGEPSMSGSATAQREEDQQAFNEPWTGSISDRPSSSQCRTHLIPEALLKSQPYTIQLLDTIAKNAIRMNSLDTKIEDLTLQLSATKKALEELSPMGTGHTEVAKGLGDYYSRTRKSWITVTSEFKTAVLWHEADAQEKHKKLETLNIPLEACLFNEDGTIIQKGPIYRAMKQDAKDMIMLHLAILPDRAMTSKYRMWAFYKKRYEPQLTKVCQHLSRTWVQLGMCSGQWKAKALVARTLKNMQQVSVNDFNTLPEDPSEAGVTQPIANPSAVAPAGTAA
ncbi:hypothetical protein CF319_g9209, partial [Tilletia indica]